MLLRRRTKRRLLAITLILGALFVFIIASAGAAAMIIPTAFHCFPIFFC